jgi:Tol biopolymer transport system component
VFERASTRVHPQESHTLRYMAAGATKHRNLVKGQGDFSKPAWGPGNRIAYVSKDSASQCVALTDAGGKTRRTLFCVKATTELARPQWSRDGRTIFIAATAPEGRLEPIFHALAFRIDVATGRGTLMSDIVMEWPLALTFSPDGTRGVYADAVAGDMTLVDFRNGATRELPRGHAPAWSPDGKRIAFTGEVYETGAEFRYYEPLYVMNADGSNVRRLTSARIADHAYEVAQWSKDNVHVLVNRRTFTDDSLTHAQYALRVIDANTKALKQLPGGMAERGAWFER